MGSCCDRFQRLSPSSSFTTTYVIFIIVLITLKLYKCNAVIVLEQWKDHHHHHHHHHHDGDGDSSAGSSSEVRRKCHLFEGRWVYDESYPLYKASSCDFIEQEFDCQKNGRPDNFYQKYRWQPNACTVPRYNGQDLLRELKGKKVLFVGDSLSLNQWQSLICMLHVAVPRSQYSLHRVGGLSTFTLPDYEISVVLSRNAFLVDIVKEKIGNVLKLDSIENGNSWKGYNVIIFNTWHWWLHTGRQQPWEYIQVGNKIEKDMNRLDAFREAIRTWSKWVDSNVNPNITKVFFQSTSPIHYNGEEWNGTSTSTCRGQSRPMGGSRYSTGPPKAAVIVKQVLSQMAKPVSLLDITTLSQLRTDGHPSVYGIYGERGNDCSHWCLPGVPDTWNQLLFAMLVNN